MTDARIQELAARFADNPDVECENRSAFCVTARAYMRLPDDAIEIAAMLLSKGIVTADQLASIWPPVFDVADGRDEYQQRLAMLVLDRRFALDMRIATGLEKSLNIPITQEEWDRAQAAHEELKARVRAGYACSRECTLFEYAGDEPS